MSNVVEELNTATQPVIVTLDAQEIGRLAVEIGANPHAFMQTLLERFKQLGVPVEGMLRLRLACGRIYRMKTSPRGIGFFSYMWCDAQHCAALDSAGGVSGQGGTYDAMMNGGVQ